MKSLTYYFNRQDVALRKADDADVSRLVDIINEAYSYQDDVKGRPRTDPGHLQERIDETDFYILEKDNTIVGCVYLEPREYALHLGLLTLIPSMRKTGLGKEIMNAIIAYSSGNQYSFLELDYMSLAPWLKEYYEKYGFQETGEVIKWGSIDLIRMRMRA